MQGYTLYVYKKDARKKEGERLCGKYDYPSYSEQAMQGEIGELKQQLYRERDGYRLEFTQTYITRKNLMNGNEFQERHDTPYYCSPSSETYWSM